METISNIASTATNAVTNLVYGAPETKVNETGGKEPVSGQTGKGTVDDPYDQGNSGAFKLSSQKVFHKKCANTIPQKLPLKRTLPPLPVQVSSLRAKLSLLVLSRSLRTSSRPSTMKLATPPHPLLLVQAPLLLVSQIRLA